MGSAGAIGGRASLNRSHIERPSAHSATTLGGIYETSPPKFSASGRGRCRAAGSVACCTGASLSVATSSVGRWRCCRQCAGHVRPPNRAERLGRPFVIDNRPGAGTNVATESVVRAPPDGHTLLFITSANSINATLYDKLNFNFIRDIKPLRPSSACPMLWK
jgi:hypothetical protein